MDEQEKRKMIEQRLKDLDVKIFSLEIDIVALEAAGSKEEAEKTREVLGRVKKSREAVEGMKV